MKSLENKLMEDTQGPYTPEEVREKMLSHMRSLSRYWAHESRAESVEEKNGRIVFFYIGHV